MKFSTVFNLALVVITSLSLFACGGGGGGGGGTALTADKMTAVTPVLINGTTTISFNFGTSVADGTLVTFTATPATAVLSNKTNVASGIATVDVTSPAQSNVVVTASITGVTGTKTVQFIPQPNRVVVHVATTKTITDLAILTFGLKTNPTVVSPYTSYALATGYTSFNNSLLAPGGDLYSWYVYDFNLNTTPSTNIMALTFTPGASAGIPFFEIFMPLSNPTNLSFNKYTKVTADPATDTLSATTNLVAADFVITTDYYLGATLLATK